MSLLTRNVLIALGITVLIIGTVLYAVNYLNQQRVAELDTIQSQLTTDTLSVETQFALLESAPCEDLSAGTLLSQEVSDLGDRLGTAEIGSALRTPRWCGSRSSTPCLRYATTCSPSSSRPPAT